MPLWFQISIAMVLGALVGSFLGPQAEYLKPLGTIFLTLINMIIVPLVFASMVAGITSIQDPKKLSRIGIKSLAFYMASTLIAIALGMSLGYFFEVGSGLGFSTPEVAESVKTPAVADIIMNIVPKNPIAAMFSGNILQILCFSFFLGLAINAAGEKGKGILTAIQSLSDVMFSLTQIVMQFSPIGVFGIMASVSGTFGIGVMLPLLKFLLVYYAACLIQALVVFCGLLHFVARVRIAPFFSGMKDAIMMAFSTCSSMATLPTTLTCLSDNLGVNRSLGSFLLPLGTTFNMAGASIFQAMSTIFIAQAYGIELSIYEQMTLIVMVVCTSIGTAGIPGGFVVLSAVVASVGLPIEGLALLAGIDRVREMVSTVMNVLGDAVVTVAIAKSEGEFDQTKYDGEAINPVPVTNC